MPRDGCSGEWGESALPASDNSFCTGGLDICAWEADHMRMGNKAKAKSIGAMLARLRWSKATDEQRAEQARKMAEGRRKKAKARGAK